MSRRLAVWISLLLVFGVLVAVAALDEGAGGAGITTPLAEDGVTYTGTTLQSGDSDYSVAVVPIVGTLVNGDSAPDGSATGGHDVVRLLDAIGRSDRFDAVLLELDTPGGSVLASAEITAAIARLQQDEDMPVVAWMRDMAASAGYYVSAGTDRIVAAPTTFTGSIGVILQYVEASELMADVGVEPVTIKSGRLKDLGSPFHDLSPEGRAVLQSIIDEAFGEFVDVVAEGREMSEARVRRLADGRVLTGRQAKQVDLVDELGLRDTAFDAVAEELELDDDEGDELRVVRFDRSYSLAEALSFGAQPTLDAARAIGAVGGMLRGDASAARSLAQTGRARAGNGVVSLEYRADL